MVKSKSRPLRWMTILRFGKKCGNMKVDTFFFNVYKITLVNLIWCGHQSGWPFMVWLMFKALEVSRHNCKIRCICRCSNLKTSERTNLGVIAQLLKTEHYSSRDFFPGTPSLVLARSLFTWDSAMSARSSASSSSCCSFRNLAKLAFACSSASSAERL